jgi:hypothetical protein
MLEVPVGLRQLLIRLALLNATAFQGTLAGRFRYRGRIDRR